MYKELIQLNLWIRKWQPTPLFSPRKFHGQRSLAAIVRGGHKDSDTTECLSTYNLIVKNTKKINLNG